MIRFPCRKSVSPVLSFCAYLVCQSELHSVRTICLSAEGREMLESASLAQCLGSSTAWPTPTIPRWNGNVDCWRSQEEVGPRRRNWDRQQPTNPAGQSIFFFFRNLAAHSSRPNGPTPSCLALKLGSPGLPSTRSWVLHWCCRRQLVDSACSSPLRPKSSWTIGVGNFEQVRLYPS